MKTRKLLYHFFCALFLIVVFTFSGILRDVKAQENIGKMRRSAPNQVVDIVTIQGKSVKNNFIFIGDRRFRVSTTAVILNYDGRKISFSLVPTPTRAEITYRIEGPYSDPIVGKIELK